jgi:hypothetical protein
MERSKRVWSDTHKRKVWPGMDQMIADFDALEKNLKDLRTVLAVIAYNQDDHLLTVPVNALQGLPKGSELEVSFDRELSQYNFKLILQPIGDESERTPIDETGSGQGVV